MAAPLFTYVQKTPKQVHDDYLRSISNGLKSIGIATPNVGPKSDYDIQGTALGNEIGVVQGNAVIQADANMPDTAAGANLDRWGTILGLTRRQAVGSTGPITLTLSAASSLVPSGAQLTDPSGLRYQVQVGGTYLNGAIVPIVAVDTGFATNLPFGTTLKWVNPPPFSSPTATVGAPNGSTGFTGGADSEIGNDEPWRNRILARLASPQGGGNWSQIAGWAAAASPYVGFCAVYPALVGPGTVQFCVSANAQTVGPFTSTSKSRVISSTIVSNVIVPYVQGLLPEHVYCTGMSSTDQPTDVALLLSLPSATNASPPGPGGGWIDGSPWPTSTSSGFAPTWVTAVTSPTVITVNAPTPPTAGVSSIAWLNPNNWTLYTAHVQSFTGSSGAYVLTLDAPMPGIAVPNFIFPQSVNQQNYVNALLGAFATMGPGEWTGNTAVLQRAFRHPLPSLTAPYTLAGPQLKQVISSGPEVLSASYLWVSNTPPNMAQPPGVNMSTPFLPGGALGSGAPAILTPRNLAFYAS